MKTCAMCEQELPGGIGGTFNPPHKEALYCVRCFGRIWIIVAARVEQALADLVARFGRDQ